MKVKATLNKVNEALLKIQNVGSVSINGTQGSFKAKGVKGRFFYNQEEEMLTIIIDDKPWLASKSMIENEINKFFK